MDIKFASLTNKQLIDQCLFNVDKAWNEFFRRFTPVIKNKIIRTLVAKDLSYRAFDKDTVHDIYLDVFKSVWLDKSIRGLTDPGKCEAWLKEISRNKTLDWIRSYNRKKNLAKKQAEESARSQSLPLNEDGSITLGDTISNDPQSSDLDDHNKMPGYLNEMGNLKPKELWALRIKVVFYDPLNRQEIDRLSQLVKRPVEEVAGQVNLIMEKLLEKNEIKEKDGDSAGRLHAIILHLQDSLLKNRFDSGFSEEEHNRITDEINKKARRLELLRKSSTGFIEPSNEEIAALIGISQEKAQGVSLLVHRARKKIKEGLNRNSITLLK
jgi:DNA-directed RNA polymerase specialized sigma24 family protein